MIPVVCQIRQHAGPPRLQQEPARWRHGSAAMRNDAGGAIGLAFAALLGQGEPNRAYSPAANGQARMRRVQDIAWPIIGLGAVAVSSWLLFKELRGLSYASPRDAFGSISPGRWVMACVSTIVAYSALAWYDRIALLHLGRKISWPFVALTSFVTYAIAHNLGASVLSGAVTLGGLLLLIHPDLVERFEGAPDWVGQAAGVALIAAPCLYVLGSLLHFRSFRIAGFELTYPRPPIAARQLLAGPLELVGAAGIIFFTLPTANPGFVVVLGVFIASFCLALVSHAPGGLGVLEIAFLSGVPDAPQANVVAALLAFRLLYLILPLVFSLAVVLVFERHRWRLLVPLGAKRAHARKDQD